MPAGAGLGLAGMVNAPAFTVSAEVTVAFGSAREARLSQVAAAAEDAVKHPTAANAADKMRAARRMRIGEAFERSCGFM